MFQDWIASFEAIPASHEKRGLIHISRGFIIDDETVASRGQSCFSMYSNSVTWVLEGCGTAEVTATIQYVIRAT